MVTKHKREIATDEPVNVFERVYQEHAGININRGKETEADIRANILDRIIHEVLGWPRGAVKREVFAKPGFIDYELSRGKPIIVVEAKAAGVSFVIPHKKKICRRSCQFQEFFPPIKKPVLH